jgi:restriction system protein
MALWLVRAGRHGEHEARFLSENKIYLTSLGLKTDQSRIESRSALDQHLAQVYPDTAARRLQNNAAQIWAFSQRMSKGDWALIPSRVKPVFNVAEITGAYVFDPDEEDPYVHSRTVKWVGRDVPRPVFGRDLLYSLGAIATVSRIERNDAEARVRALQRSGWRPEAVAIGPVSTVYDETTDRSEGVDLEEMSRDRIGRLVFQRFKRHGMERLVSALLKAQGYVTHNSPLSAEKGVVLLAAPGPLGFGHPRICVQVKSTDGPVDHPTASQLLATMHSVQADQGLLISWGGFKSSVEREIAQNFFRVRLWGQADLISQLLEHYDRLDEDIRSVLPLKKIWTVATQEPEGCG